MSPTADMQLCRTIAEIRAAIGAARRAGRTIGFVPTMGALHAGHLSLCAAARNDGHLLVVSIFVNPTQFGPQEDYRAYPRDESADLAMCRQARAAAVFLPSAQEMYRADSTTTVQVAKLSDHLCGPNRPGHFDAVAAVVAKFFNIVQPDAAYFGQKDAQQLAVIRRMARDLDFPIRIVACPTVREPDGLALSSRNRYLTPAQRAQAVALYRALQLAQSRIAAGERQVETLTAAMRAVLDEAGLTNIDYISVVDAETIQPIVRIDGPALVALAVRVGTARLIDNLPVAPP